MKTPALALAACVACLITVAETTPVGAQVVQYRFTGTRFAGLAEFGDSISGVVTLDLGVAPESTQDFTPDDGGGKYSVWSDETGDFAVEAVTSANFSAGSSLGGRTYFEVIDDPYDSPPYRSGLIHTHAVIDGIEIGFYFLTNHEGVAGDGIPAVSDWKPLEDEFTYIRIYEADIAANRFDFANYRLDSFELIRDNIVIDGRDTGVEDFEYNGRLVSEILDGYAAEAKSHDQYTGRVSKLLRELRLAGLISSEDSNAILDIAEASTIGNRPKGRR